MTAAITLKPLVIPDDQALIPGGASPELMHLLNDIKSRFDTIAAYQVPAAPEQVFIQKQYTADGTATSTTDQIPLDNTIPQDSEGALLQSLAFTPLDASSKILIEWKGYLSASDAGGAIAALFQSASADAIDTFYAFGDHVSILRCQLDSWGLTARTISVRYGVKTAAQTAYAGSTISGSAYFNGTMLNVLTVTEYKNPA